MADGIGQSCQPQLRRDIIAPSQDYCQMTPEIGLPSLSISSCFPSCSIKNKKENG
jgi:hypothetical protein